MAPLACTGATPAPDPTESPAPASIVAGTPLPANTPTPPADPTPTEAPGPPDPPTKTPRPATTPATQPTLEPTETPPLVGRFAPIRLQDSQSLQSALSEGELACIGDAPDTLARVREWPSQESKDEMLRLIGCLSDETLARLFVAGFMPGPEPLSLETSDCVRAVFAVIDPQEVMTAGIEDDPERAGRAMAASTAAATTTTACLNDLEWERSVWMTEIGPQDRADQQCLLETLGGPGEMAETMTAAGEGDFSSLDEAAATCGLDRGPATDQGPADPQTTPMPKPSGTARETTTTLVITVAEISGDIPEYDRSEWRHWVDADGDCRDARQEVLIAESLETVTFETERQCRVETGRWWAPHLGHHLGNPSHVDVDHHVPLKNAHLSGGWRWDAERKEEYANYLEDPAHLVAISARHNRSKGARGPEEWAPPDNSLWCQYATDWTQTKERWELTMTPVESAIVMDMLGTCEVPPRYAVETLEHLGSVTGEDRPTPEPEISSSVYESCAEAAEAGEQRALGSRGGGEGFPQAAVPSAGDGDGDGVVCER